MREIKFRVFFYDGKDKKTGGYYTIQDAFNDEWIDLNGDAIISTDECSIIEQYTGLKDRNGKEIFEGDIVKTGGKYPEIWVINEKEGAYNHLSINEFIYLVLYSEDHSGINSMTQSEIKVIGNINENPDLL